MASSSSHHVIHIEDDDPIVFEADVFLNNGDSSRHEQHSKAPAPRVGNHLVLLQFPCIDSRGAGDGQQIPMYEVLSRGLPPKRNVFGTAAAAAQSSAPLDPSCMSQQIACDFRHSPSSSSSSSSSSFSSSSNSRMSSRWLQVHAEYGAMVFHEREVHLTPIVGIASMGPFFEDNMVIDDESNIHAHANASEFNRLKEWTSVPVPSNQDDWTGKFLRLSASSTDPVVASSTYGSASFPASSYLDRIMTSHDDSFRQEEVLRVKDLESKSIRGIIRNGQSLEAKIVQIMEAIWCTTVVELMRIFSQHTSPSNHVPSDLDMIAGLEKCALFVRGVWILRKSRSFTPKLAYQWEYLLYLFATEGRVEREAYCVTSQCSVPQSVAFLERIAVLSEPSSPSGRCYWFLKLDPCVATFEMRPDLQQQVMTRDFSENQRTAMIEHIESLAGGLRKVKRERGDAGPEPVVKREMSAEDVALELVKLMESYGVVARQEIMNWGRQLPPSHLHAAMKELLRDVRPNLCVLSNQKVQERLGEDFYLYRECVLHCLTTMGEGKTAVIQKRAIELEAKKRGIAHLTASCYKRAVWLCARPVGTSWTLKTGILREDTQAKIVVLE